MLSGIIEQLSFYEPERAEVLAMYSSGGMCLIYSKLE